MCEGSGFAVDPFGRVFFPNLGQFRVEVIDTNNNPIATFGGYGNPDTHAYVADTVNLRVAKVKLAYAAEASAAVE
jgi:hypothetical protein